MIFTKKGKKIHPAHMNENPLGVLPIFKATGDKKYIPDIETYCQSAINKNEYRTAEHVYFKLFEITKEKKYFDKAKEMTEIMKENVSKEKLILSPRNILESLDKVLSAQNKTQEILTEKVYEKPSIMPSLKEMNELEVSIRIGSDINTLLKYVTKFRNDKDVEELRMSISLLEEMTDLNSSMALGYLFDLYQITEDKTDLDNIRKRFESYISKELNLMEAEDLLKQISYRKDF